MKLFKCLFKLLLIPSKVGSDGIVEKDQLIVQHFNLWAEQGKRPGINSTDSELDSDFLHPCFSLLTQTPRTALWGHGTSDDFWITPREEVHLRWYTWSIYVDPPSPVLGMEYRTFKALPLS